MPRRYPIATMRLRAQQRCAMENDDSIETPEWNSILSEIYADLYSIVAGSGMRYFEYVKSYTSTGANSLSEPTDHLATIDTIEYVDSKGKRRRLTQITPAERARWAGQTGDAMVWEMVDDTVYLYPTPPAGQTYELRYIAQPPDLTSFADSDVIDVVTPDGEAFLVWGAVVLALQKSKEDVTLAMQRQAEARERLTEWAAMRAFELPKRLPLERYEDGWSQSSDHDLFWQNR